LRNALDAKELAFVMAAEALATERIEEPMPRGSAECQLSTQISARNIGEATDKDRANRKVAAAAA
jgi:hypothetical protein